MNLLQMQNTVDNIFITMGVRTNFVSVQSTRDTIASTIGVKVNDIISALGFEPPAVVGIININEKILSKGFTDSEIRFILAHECSHIFSNHVISTLFWNMLENTFKGEKKENREIVELLKVGFVVLAKSHLPPNAETLRNQEYEADKMAVSITEDVGSAISCLSKLGGNNMDAPSHTWELFDSAIPAMTMGQRIEILRHNFCSFL